MTREELERRAQQALRCAIAGDHPFLGVDVDAPMGTLDLEPGTKPRMSPDVWRHLLAALLDARER